MRLFALLSLTALAQVPEKHVNVSNSEALSGYDPLSYFEGAPQRGNMDLSFNYAGVVYRFASEAPSVPLGLFVTIPLARRTGPSQ